MCELHSVTKSTFNREMIRFARMEDDFDKASLERGILEWMPYGVSDTCHNDCGLLINHILELVAQQGVSVQNRSIYHAFHHHHHHHHNNPGLVGLADCGCLFSKCNISLLTTFKLCLY